METLNIVFKNNQYWDKKTGKRIVLKDNQEIVMTLNSKDQIYDVDPNNEFIEPKSEREIYEMLDEMKMNKKIQDFRKVLDVGENLNFHINAGEKTEKIDDRYKVYFTLTLKEPLYLTLGNGKTRTEESAYECRCVVNQASSNNMNRLPFFESINATSLNDAYSKTYVLYFDIFGKSSTNVFKKMGIQSMNGAALEILRKLNY